MATKLKAGQKLIDSDGRKWIVESWPYICSCDNPLIKRKIGFYCDLIGPSWLDDGDGVYTIYRDSINTMIVVCFIAVVLNILFVILCAYLSPGFFLEWPLVIFISVFNMGATWWCCNGGSWGLRP